MYRYASIALATLWVVALGCGDRANRDKGGEKNEQAKTDKEIIQGTWKLVTVAVLSNNVKDAMLESTDDGIVTFKGDKFFATKDGKEQAFDIAVDSSKTPKEIDITITPMQGGKEAKKTIKGIYELKDDLKAQRLRIATGSLVAPPQPDPKAADPVAKHLAAMKAYEEAILARPKTFEDSRVITILGREK